MDNLTLFDSLQNEQISLEQTSGKLDVVRAEFTQKNTRIISFLFMFSFINGGVMC